jgi:hypothetical protein
MKEAWGMNIELDRVETKPDVTLALPWAELFALRAILERDRLGRQKAGASLYAIDKLIERVERALFPRSLT